MLDIYNHTIYLRINTKKSNIEYHIRIIVFIKLLSLHEL